MKSFILVALSFLATRAASAHPQTFTFKSGEIAFDANRIEGLNAAPGETFRLEFEYEFTTQRQADHVRFGYSDTGAEILPSCYTQIEFAGRRRLRFVSNVTGAILDAQEYGTRLVALLRNYTNYGATCHRHEYASIASLRSLENTSNYYKLKDGNLLYVDSFVSVATGGSTAPEVVLGIQQRRGHDVVPSGGDYILDTIELSNRVVEGARLQWFVVDQNERGNTTITRAWR